MAGSSNRKFVATRAAYVSAGLAATAAEVDRLVERNAAYTVEYYARGPALGITRYRRRLQRTIEPQGTARLDRAAGRGGGVILVAPHLGDFELAASFVAEVLGLRLVVPVATIAPAARQLFYDRIRVSCGFTLRREGFTRAIDLVRDLRAGHALILMCDRRPARGGAEVTFFGRRARVSTAPYVLARLSGAPIVSASTWTEGRRRLLRFGEPVDASSMAAAADTLQRVVGDAERAIARAPHQWHVPAQLDQLPWVDAARSS